MPAKKRDSQQALCIQALSKSYQTKTSTQASIEALSRLDIIKFQNTYQQCVREYTQIPYLTMFGQNKSPKVLQAQRTMIEKIIGISRKMNVSFKTYIQAQIYFYHQWFSRYPRLGELMGYQGTCNCEWRVTEFLKLSGQDQNKPSPRSPVVPRKKLKTKDLAEINETRVTELAKAWNLDRDEVFKNFGFSGMFDRNWLQKQPEYKKFLSHL
jgi:hypothetical protein